MQEYNLNSWTTAFLNPGSTLIQDCNFKFLYIAILKLIELLNFSVQIPRTNLDGA